MKICFVTNRNIVKNANMKRAFGMAPYLLARGHQPAIMLEDHPANREFAARQPDVEYVYFPPAKPRAERRLKRQLLDERDDAVVVICSLSVRNMVRCRRRPRPVQLLDHPEIPSAFENTGRVRPWFEYAAEWWAMGAYDGHLAVSRYLERRLKSRMRRLGKRERVLYSPFAAEDEVRAGDPQRVAAVRAKYPGKIVLYLGTLLREYGFFEMLEAAAKVAAKRRDFTLVLAGAGPELEAGTRLVAERGLEDVVVFPGFLSGDELCDFLYAAHAFICPMNDTVRDWARSPGKIYMYAATGRPIVTSPIGEARDTLGEDGYYYEQGSAASMAGQIERSLDAPAGPLGKYARESLFWDDRTDRFLEWLGKDFGLR